MAAEITQGNDGEIVIPWFAIVAAVVVAAPWFALVLTALAVWCIAWALAYASIAVPPRSERMEFHRTRVMAWFGPTPFARTRRFWLNAATFGFWDKLYPSRRPSTPPAPKPGDAPETFTWIWASAIGVVLIVFVAVFAFPIHHGSRALAATEPTVAVTSQTSSAPTGSKNIVVPSFAGKTVAEAGVFFRSVGLPVTVVHEPSYLTPGTVLDQYPSAGQSTIGWSRATITVAVRFPVIPVVVGKSVGDAKAALHDRGLTMTIQYEPSYEPAGTVLKQTPWQGNHGWPGQAVVVTVAAP